MTTTVAVRALPRALQRSRRLSSYKSIRHVASTAGVDDRALQPNLPTHAPSSPTNYNRNAELHPARTFSDFLTDTFNRQHDYLRISLTERCNLRCLYCMPEEGIQLSPNKDILTAAEIHYLSALFVDQGVNKIRLTGGEPTVRKDIIALMRQLGNLRRNGLRELALTTNGISLHRKLDDMVEAGLTGVNISLDTLDPHQFVLLTRRQGFDAVMKSINRVLEINKLGGNIKLKINCVAMRGLNDHQILPFVNMTQDQDIEVRFIEYMPFGGNKWSQKKMLPYEEMLDLIRVKYPGICRSKGSRNDTSKTWQVPGFKGKVGFITSMTHNFCGTCNRLRITSDGNLKVCLHGNTEVSLRDILRKDNLGEPMDEAAFDAVRRLELDRKQHQQLQHQQGILKFDGEEGWISKERELLKVIGAAVKRKKAAHAGMGKLENLENRPMILIDEKGSRTNAMRPRRPHILSSQSMLPRTSPLFQMPPHLLPSLCDLTTQVRLYSSNSENGSKLQSDRAEIETKAAEAPPRSASAFGFQSLSGLFESASTGRYSRPRHSYTKSEHAESRTAEVDALTNPREDKNVSAQSSTAPTRNAQHRENSTPVEEKVAKSSPYGVDVVTSAKQKRPTNNPTSGDPEVHLGREAVTPVWRSGEHQPSRRRRVRGQRYPASSSGKPFQHDPYIPTFANDKVPSVGPTETKSPGSLEIDTANAWGLGQDSVKSTVSLQDQERAMEALKEQPLLNQSSRSIAKNIERVPSAENRLTHVNSAGEAHMVDVGAKRVTNRVAVAVGGLRIRNRDLYRLIIDNGTKKGDVLAVARVAGIMAAKRTSDLIPLCHPVQINKVEIDISLRNQRPGGNPLKGVAIGVQALVECNGQTGVEMEALTAVAGTTLAIYDMCKAVDRHMIISSSRVVYKSGGRTGTYTDPTWPDWGKDLLAEHNILIDGLDVDKNPRKTGILNLGKKEERKTEP